MSTFIVTYDLMTPGKDYNRLYARLGDWRATHALQSVWFIDAATSAASLRDDLKGYIDSNDRLFVAVLSGESAWTAMMAGAGPFLQARFGVAA